MVISSFFHPGDVFRLRDGRIVHFLYYGFEGDLCCCGDSVDDIHFWHSDCRWDDDPDFVSDADIVSFELTLF